MTDERNSWKSRAFFLIACVAIAAGVCVIGGYVGSQYLMQSLDTPQY